jgi:hypothetical protein
MNKQTQQTKGNLEMMKKSIEGGIKTWNLRTQ